MERRLPNLAEREFDVVVIGGGVYGAAIAWDAAQRGLSVALVEKDDFGGATSSNSSKIVHGGIRYLQHGDLGRMRESIRERSILMRIAPHLVHPLPFLIPTYRDLKRSRVALGAAVLLNDLLGWDRNRGADPGKRIPRGRLVSRDQCLRMAPGVAREGLTGGAVWYDAQMYNSDRLTLSFVLAAARAGAEVANHLEVVGFLSAGDRITGVRAEDGLGGGSFDVRARVVVNAAGPWVGRVLGMLDDPGQASLQFSKAMNLVTRRLVDGVALGVASPAGHRDADALVQKGWRFVTIIPWRDASIVGTWHSRVPENPEALAITERDIASFLEEVNRACPGARLARGDVRLVHRGWLPVTPRAALIKHSRIVDHLVEGGPAGLISVVGVKYTTARGVAEKCVHRVFERLSKKPPACRTAATPLPGGEIEGWGDFVKAETEKRSRDLHPETTKHLLRHYGAGYGHVLELLDEEPGWTKPVAEGSTVLAAEVVHAVRKEMAASLESVVLRRTELGSAGHPGRPALEACAALMAKELAWPPDRIQREIAHVEAFFQRAS